LLTALNNDQFGSSNKDFGSNLWNLNFNLDINVLTDVFRGFPQSLRQVAE